MAPTGDKLMRAVGIDLSLAGTGLASVETTNTGLEYRHTTIKSTGHTSDTLRQRRERLFGIVAAVSRYAMNADLVIVEGPSFMSKGGSNWDRAGLWWGVVDMLMLDQHTVAIAPPTVVKKFAAGKGSADKPAVAVGVARLWGEGCQCANDNEWDALALATMGAQRLGIDGVPTRAHHAATLESVAWDTEGAVA